MGVNEIGVIEFLDIKVRVYHDQYNDGENPICCWGMRNPDTCYTGLVYGNFQTGEITYPDDAIIPEQTPKDREILPKFIVVGVKELNDDLINSIKVYLDSEYLRRN